MDDVANKNKITPSLSKPKWLKTPIPRGEKYFQIKNNLRRSNLVTVCEEAKCPNIGNCWSTGTATFMILGETCTRACRFCHIKTGNPMGKIDPNEASQIANTCQTMNLRYAVLTMVDRDDLKDGGSSHITSVIYAIRKKNPNIKIEILTGDFAGQSDPLKNALRSQPHVFAHNLETVERLSPRVRDARASYRQSLTVLERSKVISSSSFLTKSSLLLGLGEQPAEILQTLKDMKNAGVDIVTMGQYMRPTKKHLSVKQWIHPKIFKNLEEEAYAIGFRAVVSHPLVRSSYKAEEVYTSALKIPYKSPTPVLD